jgi:polysaccharide biosynthesis/export protein
MSRLSDILDGRLGPYSSLRNIQVIPLGGKKQRYDLFQFRRLGQVDQNPYVRAGDTIVVSSAERSVEIAGEVKRPGKYQLLPADQLKEMIESFGGGLTSAAETSRIRINRVFGENAQTLYVTLADGRAANMRLEDGDSIFVPSKTDSLPIAFFEGAVIQEAPAAPVAPVTTETANLISSVSYNRIPYSFREGETLRSALISVRSSIQPSANLTAASVIRTGTMQPIPVDLAALLSGTNTAMDFVLRPLDRIIIPSGQFSVVVSGDVARPGSYPYTPSKTYRAYADLAGFADVEEIPDNILVLDSRGKRRDIGEAIEPGSRIYLTGAKVAVQGAVFNPGSFSYRKDFSIMNYENLAGGFDPEKSSGGATVFDAKGKERSPKDAIQPGDRIYVHVDKFIYNFNKDLPVFLSVVGIAGTIVTIYALLR